MQTKVCTKCGIEKEATSEYFIRCKANQDGLRCSCKQCMREYDNNRKEQRVEYNKAYRADNIEYLINANRIYREENHERELSRGRKYRANNAEKLLIKGRQFYLLNKAKENERFRVYYQNNKAKIDANINRRRTRKLVLSATLTVNQWENIKSEFNNCCAYCGKEKPLAQEHFIACSKGGEYTVNNIIPSCQSCNSSKKDKDFKNWYKNYKHYNEKRESKILKYLHYNNGIQQLTLEF